MHTRIDYLVNKYSFTELNESPRLRRQWQDVLEECRQTEAGPEERLRIALLNVDYVTSFELPFRLLLTRTPQLIAALREEWGISQKLEFKVVFHLDLDEWSFPYRKPGSEDKYTPLYPTLQQELNLHYVGITRAENCIVLINSCLRENSCGEFKKSDESYFLNCHN